MPALASAPESDFAEIAYTLQVGRKQMAHRRFVVATDAQRCGRTPCGNPTPLRCGTKRCRRAVIRPWCSCSEARGPSTSTWEKPLYGEPLFRAIVDDCCEILKPHLGRDLRDLFYPL